MVWSDTLKKKPWVLEMIETYFSVMQSKNVGKASTHFFERASELNNIVLTNKTYQKTRFVRALQRGITAFLRNLPTLHHIVSEEYLDALRDNNKTLAKQLVKVVDYCLALAYLSFWNLTVWPHLNRNMLLIFLSKFGSE